MANLSEEERGALLRQLGGLSLPRHAGVIMDGNGRWAQQRMLPRKAGHRAGAETLGTIARFARDAGIEYITFYTFSTENWKRPESEVQGLMELLHNYLSQSNKYIGENIRVRFLGDLSALSPELQEECRRTEEESRGNTGLNMNLALNYGGQDEIVRAAQSLARNVQAGALAPEDIDIPLFASRLYTAGMPECDVIIRPSGEMRLSNFLLWQAAYAEFVFMDTLWPDFTEQDFVRALMEYARRSRRFGGR